MSCGCIGESQARVCLVACYRALAMTPEQMLLHLRRASAIARDAMALGHHPFGALLVDADGQHRAARARQCRHGRARRVAARAHRGAPLHARAPVALHAGDHRRALRDVRGHAVLGPHRPSGLRHERAPPARADRQSRREPDAGPAVSRGLRARPEGSAGDGPGARDAEAEIAAVHREFWARR